MPTLEKIDEKPITKEIVVNTKVKKAMEDMDQSFKWWLAESDDQLTSEFLSTMNYLKKTHQIRVRQASIYTRLFSGKPLYNYLANVGSLDNSQQLPIGRPTANVTYSCIDTLVSTICGDNRPRPIFQTNGAHYKERRLAKEYNDFLMGELFRTKAYEFRAIAFRDSCVLGNGFVHVYPQVQRDSKGKAIKGKVALERVLETELLTDYNDAYYGSPRNIIRPKLVDRGVLLANYPDKTEIILKSMHGNVDNTPLSTETVTDQIIVGEGYHLPSGEGTGDGRHVIITTAGPILDEEWTKPKFPFVKWSYNPNMVGYFAQGLAEILMPTQMEIYKLLIIASQAIELMGVPRILIDEFSSILETAFNNNIGTIIKYNKVPPQFVTAESNNPEIYEWIKWLIQNAYQMSGISTMTASGQKPAGLNSGEAQREYVTIQDRRFAQLQMRDKDCMTELSYQIMDCAKDIAKETGFYTTVYPGKDGIREVELPKADILEDTYIIQCADESSLPNDPAGRQAKLSEMLAAGEITNQEFRRLSSFPDLKQSDELANALEERILQNLDAIIDKGKKGFSPPDPFILDSTDLATTLTVNYINKYSVTDIEESKMQLLRDYFTQIQVLKAKANPPPPPQIPPQGTPNQAGLVPVAPPAPSQAPTSGAQV